MVASRAKAHPQGRCFEGPHLPATSALALDQDFTRCVWERHKGSRSSQSGGFLCRHLFHLFRRYSHIFAEARSSERRSGSSVAFALLERPLGVQFDWKPESYPQLIRQKGLGTFMRAPGKGRKEDCP